MSNTLEDALRATAQYFSALGYPLHLPSVRHLLYQWNGSPSADEIRACARSSSHFEVAGDYCELRGAHLIDAVLHAASASRKLWEKVERYRPLLASCPGVEMVAVVNSLAYGAATEQSDIDLFIICKRGMLHEARAWLKCVTQLFGLRVRGSRRAGRFCFSFMVSEEHLDLSVCALPFDPHLAYFVATAVPIFGRDAYLRWLAANAWVKRYLPRGVSPRMEKLRDEGGRMHRHMPFLRSALRAISRIEIARERRRARLAGPDADIRIEEDIFKFHEHDRRREIARVFASSLDARR